MATSFRPMSKKIRREDVLDYHSRGRPGKIEVVPTKPTATARDLSLAYTPGVAEPCLDIAKDPDLSYTYTARGNLVAVVSNGTAVLGLGDIGPYAGKPVMEGKGVLFKRFADIDVFDLCIDAKDVDSVCRVVKALEPTFGGINLEDIKAPDCFLIEERLKREMQIPVFHDDQHGTAIISGAALINAVELVNKPIESLRVVVSGAGASELACPTFWWSVGIQRENVVMVDHKGGVWKGRGSVKGLVTQEMLKRMAPRPIVFALANPDPEISYPDACEARPDAIIATGRSDYPNQVNNVLGFPYIFRGALDVRARSITEGMKLAAARALAALAREDVPDSVTRAYGGEHFTFGPDYIIPKPFDPRVLLWVAPAVAKAAIEDGVARKAIDLEGYRERLQRLQSRRQQVMATVFEKARTNRKRIALNDGEDPRVLQAAAALKEDGICEPILLGDKAGIERSIVEHRLEDELKGVRIADPTAGPDADRYAEAYWKKRQRRGLNLTSAQARMRRRGYFGSMMVELGDADGLVTGLTHSYASAIRPPLEIIGARAGMRACGVYIVVTRSDFKFFADCTLDPDPTPEHLAQIASTTADLAQYFDVKPRVAFLSYSNFGDVQREDSPTKMRRATELARKLRPDLEIDGEMQVDPALVSEEREERYSFSTLTDDANVLVFPNLDAANIAYKLLWRFGGAEVIGPLLLGMNKAVNVLQQNAGAEEIINLAAVAALRAQREEFPF